MSSDHPQLRRKLIFVMNLDGVTPRQLHSLAGKSVVNCFVPVKQNLTSAWLFLLRFGTGEALAFSTEPMDLGDWDEAGRLNIRYVPEAEIAGFDFPTNNWTVVDFDIDKSSKLVFEDETLLIDVGISLTSKRGHRIIITAGIPPGSVSVLLGEDLASFAPQFRLDECMTLPFVSDAS